MSAVNSPAYSVQIPVGAVMQEAPKSSGGVLKKILTIAAGIILGVFLVVLSLIAIAKITGSTGKSLGDSRLKVNLDKLTATGVTIGLRNRNSSPLVIQKMEMQIHLDNKLVSTMTKTNFTIDGSWTTNISHSFDSPASVKENWPYVKYYVTCDLEFKDFNSTRVSFKANPGKG
jgi:hypothetical protein